MDGGRWLVLRGQRQRKKPQTAYLGEMLLHNLGSVVDGKNDIGNTGSGKGLNLV